jgi:hypothetical protein
MTIVFFCGEGRVRKKKKEITQRRRVSRCFAEKRGDGDRRASGKLRRAGCGEYDCGLE